jgi:hypothetical protein
MPPPAYPPVAAARRGPRWCDPAPSCRAHQGRLATLVVVQRRPDAGRRCPGRNGSATARHRPAPAAAPLLCCCRCRRPPQAPARASAGRSRPQRRALTRRTSHRSALRVAAASCAAAPLLCATAVAGPRRCLGPRARAGPAWTAACRAAARADAGQPPPRPLLPCARAPPRPRRAWPPGQGKPHPPTNQWGPLVRVD